MQRAFLVSGEQVFLLLSDSMDRSAVRSHTDCLLSHVPTRISSASFFIILAFSAIPPHNFNSI